MEYLLKKKYVTFSLVVACLLVFAVVVFVITRHDADVLTGLAIAPSVDSSSPGVSIPFSSLPLGVVPQVNSSVTPSGSSTRSTSSVSGVISPRRNGSDSIPPVVIPSNPQNPNVPISIPPGLIPKSSKFRSGRTTDWSRVANLSRVCGGEAVVEIPGLGSIKWFGCVNASGADFDRDINITGGVVSLDSLVMDASFNSAAEVTMTNLPSLDYVPVIYRNGQYCPSPQCELLSYDGSSAVFRVSSFSSYTLGANARLDVWDETDPSSMPLAGLTKYPGDNITFFANYTNITSGVPIASGVCHINFSDSNVSMTYNASLGVYQYTRNFSSASAYSFNVSCFAPSFASLHASDLVSVSTLFSSMPSTGPSGANVSLVSTSRGAASAPQNHSSVAGNVTEISVGGKSITQGWQGYYGNVSGTILLANALGSVLYNWSANSPQGEVYASRSSGVNFANISCASTTFVANEESTLGQVVSDVDSITNTFSQLNHPQFFVGSINISQNSCFSTNVFTASGSQSTVFFEVLLADNSAHLVYTVLLEDDVLGFDSFTHDFELLVAEDGHGVDTATTPYFFYVELQ